MKYALSKLLVLLILSGSGINSLAQTEEENETDQTGSSDDVSGFIEEVVTIGTRRQSKTISDSAVPVDLYVAEQLDAVNSSDLIEVLSTIVPSFSVRRQPISDGASFVRPTHLRNMEPHHSLVLVSGKRRHRSAFMWLGGYGAHGADIGNVPSIAIESVEILRDGAAAQYGSDAIAGVINFRLREDNSGSMFRTRYGEYKAGDGEELTFEGYIGTGLTADGFLNLSFQFSDAGPTSRSGPYDISIAGTGILPHEAVNTQMTVDGVTYYGPDAFSYTYSDNGTVLQVLPGADGIPDDIDTRYADNYSKIGGNREFEGPAQIWGQPDRKQVMLAANAGVPLSELVELYAFSTYSHKEQSGGFFYRRAGISTFLPVRLADGSIYSARRNLFPGGFTPQFTGDVFDTSLISGLRGLYKDTWYYDLSVGYGGSRIEYQLANTLNPSLGPETPTEFHPGNLINKELSINFDSSREIDLGLALSSNLAFGLEYRNETYRIEQGDPASYAVGPYGFADPFNFEITRAEVDADPNDDLIEIECRIPGFEVAGGLCPTGDPVNNSLPIGSNGFPGYSPTYSSDYSQFSYAAYVDLEVDLQENWLVNAAVRFEDFEDFGSVAIWKLASRLKISPTTNLRGSLGTGFRAPTAGQLSTTNVSTRIGAGGLPISVGIFPASHPASNLFGSIPLDAEHSNSFTLGLTTQLWGEIDLALDYYSIELKDRIILSSRFSVSPEQTARLLELQVPAATEIGLVSFFTNDVETETSGFDLATAWTMDSWLGKTTFQANMNFNRTELSKRGVYIGDEGEYDIENGIPDNRMTLSISHNHEKVDVMLRLRRYGEYSNSNDAALTQIQTFQSEWFVDIGATFPFNEKYEIRIGAENIFDNYPDAGEFEACCGRIYRSDSLVPWQGALYYAQFRATFP